MTAMSLAIALIMIAGATLRVIVAGEPLFADELSTYWIVTDHGLGGVLSTVHSNAEITPPLSFVLSWLAIQVSTAPEMVRAPSLVAGTLTVPLVYVLGLRTVGRNAALTAAALTAFSPFMIYYSAEARAYGLVMFLVVLSTLAMLLALDTRRRRWWALYAACTCAAVYTHYTSVFALGAQLLWLFGAHPESRRHALLANAAAATLFLPWVTGLRNDLDSPTTEILSALAPFTPEDVWVALQHWAVGYPYAFQRLQGLPGPFALGVLAAGISLASWAAIRRTPRTWPSLRGRHALVLAILVSVPLCEAAVSAVSTNLFGTRNLAVAWPYLGLALGALLTAPGPKLQWATAPLAVAAFAIGAVRMLDVDNKRPDYRAAADFIDRNARSGDVLVDATGAVSPGPLTPIDATIARPIEIYRAAAPEERERPFELHDRLVPKREAMARAAEAAEGRGIFLVTALTPSLPTSVEEQRQLRARSTTPGYRTVGSREFRGVFPVIVEILEPR